MNDDILDSSVLDEYSPELLTRLLSLFQQQAPQTIAKLKQHVAQHNAAALARDAHYLKGSSSALGAAQLAELCKQLQIVAEKNDLHNVDGFITQLEQSYNRFIKILQNRQSP